MALLRFASLAAGSMVLLHGSYGEAAPAAGEAPADPIVESADDCLKSMNEARTAVGYTPFTATQDNDRKLHPIPPPNKAGQMEDVKKFWKTFCKGMQGVDFDSNDAQMSTAELKGTVAYTLQKGKDCAAAVEYWKGGFAKFGSALPPAFGTTDDGDNKAPYDTEQAVSFIALYNPNKSTDAECVFVTCPAHNPTKPPQGQASRRLAAVEEAKALFCLSHPDALVTGKQPYQEEEWKKIVDVFAPGSSASIAMPTFLALAAAAVGLAVM